ncbi:MAG: hypothetical protein JNL92_15830, partial [Opitutaceae bacterium]|nr:hypothetical protein [Opitutaceae bacterium]
MATVTLIAALFSLGLTIAVLWVNPFRFSNQAFAIVSFLQTTWLWCVYRAMRASSTTANNLMGDLEFWLRANSAVIAFLPASFWLLNEAILSNGRKFHAIIKALPLYILGVLALIPINSTFFITYGIDGTIKRDFLYYTFTAFSILAFGGFVFKVVRGIRISSGVRRVELQFLALTVGGSSFIISILNITGNILQLRELKNAGIIGLLAASVLTAWALLFHRVFNAREVLLHLYHRCT